MSMFEYFIKNVLFAVFQSGHSCTSQILSIIHEIQKSFHESPPTDVRGTILEVLSNL